MAYAMPKSWSKAKRDKMLGCPKLTTPDLDNCIGAVMDALLDDDSTVWRLRDPRKVWFAEDLIMIEVF